MSRNRTKFPLGSSHFGEVTRLALKSQVNMSSQLSAVGKKSYSTNMEWEASVVTFQLQSHC